MILPSDARACTLATLVCLPLAACAVPGLGLPGGRLTPCPQRPNCVTSTATAARHRVAALPLVRSVDSTRAALKTIVAALPRTALLTERADYLRFVCRSLVFRFKDDLEFHLVPAEGLVHVRSAARVGYSDFGVNRARVAAVRRAYQAWLGEAAAR